MTNAEIERERKFHEIGISKHKEKLAQLQNKCPHTNTFVGDYSWRVGSTDNAVICTACHKLISINSVEDDRD